MLLRHVLHSNINCFILNFKKTHIQANVVTQITINDYTCTLNRNLNLPFWLFFETVTLSYWIFLIGGDSATNTIRLKGYSIRGSNTTAQSSITHVCYNDTGATTLPTIIEVECKLTARYIWFYQSHAPNKEVPMLEICEVQVFGMFFFYLNVCSCKLLTCILLSSMKRNLFVCLCNNIW